MQSDVPAASKAQPAPTVPSNAAWPPGLGRLILGAIVTAALGFAILRTLYPIFTVPEEIANFPEQSPRWMYDRLEATKAEVDGQNFMLVFGAVGAFLGACYVLFPFGLKSFKAILIGAVATAGLGVAGAYLSNGMFTNLRLADGKDLVMLGITLDGMKQSILAYSLLWGLMGLGVGLGIGSVRGFGKAIVAGISGLCGGALGAMLYVILTAQFAVGTAMDRVVPYDATNQAIYLSLFTVVMAVCIGLGTGEKRPKASGQ